jgi:hypothetical protein
MIEYNDQLVLQRGDGSASASEAHISQTPSADGELRLPGTAMPDSRRYVPSEEPPRSFESCAAIAGHSEIEGAWSMTHHFLLIEMPMALRATEVVQTVSAHIRFSPVVHVLALA